MISTEQPMTFVDWCHHVVASPDYVVLDTETTSLDGELVELAIIDMAGKELYNSLLRPLEAITPEATAVHHITKAMLAQAPTIAEEWPKVCDIIAGRAVITYNAKFDFTRIKHSLACYNLITCDACAAVTFECAMLGYAEHWNAPPRWEGANPPWQNLERACYQQGVTLNPKAMHRALADAQATLALLCKVAATGLDSPRYRSNASLP